VHAAWVYVLLPLAGFASGVINTLAGGGSFIVLPCLVLLGMPEQVANGTNRLAIALQSLYSVRAYQKRRPIEVSALPGLLIPSLPGLALGAAVATFSSPSAYRQVVGALFLAFAGLMLLEPRLLLEKREGPRAGSRALQVIVLFVIGVYAGFLQAGVGLLLLAALAVLQRRELVEANGLKLAVIAVWIVPTVIWFALARQIEWVPGLLVGVGNFVGASVGARWAVSKGNRLIFAVVVGITAVTGLSLLWF
jgi:uncharacterized membrane protein YfcA